jgi:GNAT superfamily N-acetyltransferase
MISFELCANDTDLEQILALQRSNHASVIDPALWDSEGFVTVEYDVPTLALIQGPYRHAIARVDGQVMAYALVLLRQNQAAVPFLAPMFEAIDKAVALGRTGGKSNYLVMGQICVAPALRGQGVFRGLYDTMRQQMRDHFDFIATEVAFTNPRSVRAHQRVGFKSINEDSPDWQIIAWDWT